MAAASPRRNFPERLAVVRHGEGTGKWGAARICAIQLDRTEASVEGGKLMLAETIGLWRVEARRSPSGNRHVGRLAQSGHVDGVDLGNLNIPSTCLK
jgi:hypothetical protein